MTTTRQHLIRLTPLCCALTVSAAHAADGTWTSTATPRNWDDATNWSSGVIADGPDSTANFTSDITAATTVSLNGTNRTIGNLLFSDNGANVSPWTVTGNILTLSATSPAAPTITTTADATISSVVAGTAGLTKAGASILILNGSGSNTFSGTTTVNQGVLSLSKTGGATAIGGNLTFDNTSSPDVYTLFDNQFAAGAVVSFVTNAGDHGRLDLQGTTQTVAGIQMVGYAAQRGVIQNREAGPINTATSTLVLNGSDPYTFTGFLRDGSGSNFGKLALTKSGSGTQTLTGNQINYTGATSVTGGTLALSGTTAFTSSTTVGNGATLEVLNTVNLVMNTPITLNNGATLKHSGSVNNLAYWVNSQPVTVASGAAVTLHENSVANTTAQNKNTFVDGGLRGGGGGAVVTINATNAGNAVVFRNFNGRSTYAGSIVVNGIASATSNAGSGIGVSGDDTGLRNANIEVNGTMELAGNGIGWAGTNPASAAFNMGALSGTGVVASNGTTRTLVIGNTGTNAAFPGTLANGTAASSILGVTKVGSGIQALSNTNTYTGATTACGGTLQLDFATGGTSNIIAPTSALVLGGGTFEIKGGSGEAITQTVGGLSGAGILKLTSNGATSIDLTLGAVAGGANFVGSDATPSGPGSLNFLTSTTTTGDDGTTRLGMSLWNGTGWASTSSVGGANRVVEWQGAYAPLTTDGAATNSTGDLRILGGSGPGTATTYNANTNISSLLMAEAANSSTVDLTSGTSLTVGSGASPANAVVAINASGNSLTIGSVAGQGTLTAGDSGATALNLFNHNAASSLTVNSVIANNAGSGALTLSTLGKVVSSAANTYTGGTNIGGGVLQINGAGSLGTGSYAGAIANNGTLQFSSSAAQTLSGVISGPGGLLKDTGTGSLILTGANTYTGVATVNSGTLQLGNGTSTTNSATTGTYVLGAAGTLHYLRFNDVVAPAWGSVSGSGVLSIMTNRANSGTTNDWGQATLPAGFTGTLQIERGRVFSNTPASLGNATAVIVKTSGHLGMWPGGTYGQSFTIEGTGYGETGYESALRLANAGMTTTVNGTVTLSGDATVAATGTGILNNTISGGFGLSFGSSAQAGLVTLNGANTYTGSTTVAFGTAQFSKQVALYNNVTGSWTDTNLVVNSGATAAFNVGGANEFTAADIDTLKALGTGTGGFKTGSFLGLDTTNAAGGAFTSNSPITNPNGGSNVLGLRKLGTGTLVLPGANAYTGNTTISGGTLELAGSLGVGGSYPGTISGAGSLLKSSADVQTFTGAGTHTGTTTISNGVLTLGTGGTLSNTSSITIASGATLNLSGGAFNQLATGTTNGTLAINGTLNATTNQAHTLSNGTTYFATIAMNNGTLANTFGQNTSGFGNFFFGASRTITATGANTISGLGVIGASTGVVVTLSPTNANDSILVSGTIGQGANGTAGGIAKAGLGTVTLSGTGNLYTGPTTVNAGTLKVNGTKTGGGAVTVNNTGTLGGSGSIAGATTVQSGGTLAPGDGVGTTTFTSTVTLAAGSTYAAEIASGGNDKVTATTLTANGTIKVTLVGGYSPATGTTFDLADATTLAGTPAFDFTAAVLAPGLSWDTTTFATDGTIKVATGSGSAYDTWATANGVTGGKGGDDDGDGVTNLLEFATASNAKSGTSGARVYPLVHTIGGQKVLTYTVAVRAGATFAPNGSKQQADRDGVRYVVEASNQLGTWDTVVVSQLAPADATAVQAALGTQLNGLDAAWQWHSFRTDGDTASDASDFIRLTVGDAP